MFFLVVLAGLCAALWSKKPPLESFDRFWRTRTFTNRLLSTLDLSPYSERKCWDLLICWLVACIDASKLPNDPSYAKWFVGVWGQWLRIPKEYSPTLSSLITMCYQKSDSTSDDLTGSLEDEALKLQKKGELRKASAKFAQAAILNKNPYERGVLYEKAAALEEYTGSLDLWKSSGKAFKQSGQLGHAARCFLQAAERTTEPDDQIECLQEAMNLYEADADRYLLRRKILIKRYFLIF